MSISAHAFTKITLLILAAIILMMGAGFGPAHAQPQRDFSAVYTFPETGTTFAYDDAVWTLEEEDTFAVLTNDESLLVVLDYTFVSLIAPDQHSLAAIAEAVALTLYDEASLEAVELDTETLLASQAAGVDADADDSPLSLLQERTLLLFELDTPTDQLEIGAIRFENGQVGVMALVAPLTAEAIDDALLPSLLSAFDNTSPPDESGFCVALTDTKTDATASEGPGPLYTNLLQLPSADGFWVDGQLQDASGQVWWKLAPLGLEGLNIESEQAWVSGAVVSTIGNCNDVTAYIIPADDTASPAGQTLAETAPEGDIWSATFGSMSASCTEDTESAYVPEPLEPTTVFIALTDEGLLFGDTVLTAFAEGNYEGFLNYDAGDEVMVARIYVETTSEASYQGTVTLNFNNNTCSATVSMTLTRLS